MRALGYRPDASADDEVYVPAPAKKNKRRARDRRASEVRADSPFAALKEFPAG
jgi:hypothetical protein